MPLAPAPRARGSLPALQPEAPRWTTLVAATPLRAHDPAPAHAAAQVQRFRRVGRWSPGGVVVALLALVAAVLAGLGVLGVL